MSNKVLKFSASWCSPCKELARRLEAMGQEVEEIDVDANEELAAQYGIRGVPTMVMLDDAGKEISRLVGSKSTPDLIDWFNQ